MTIETTQQDDVIVPVMSMERPDGSLVVITPMNATVREQLQAAGLDTSSLDTKSEPEFWTAANNWQEGNIIYAGGQPLPTEQMFRTPRLSVPTDFYTRVQYSREYYESEPLVYSLVNRDIDQAITTEEFQLPEDEEVPKKALQRWRSNLNKLLGHHGGLSEYNRSLTLELILGGLTFTLANWSTILVEGEIVEVPVNFINFPSEALVPDIDTLTGQRKYYYKLSAEQAEQIKNTRKNTKNKPSIMQIIPDAKERLRDNIEFLSKKYSRLLGYDASWMTSLNGEMWLELPVEDAYIINFRAKTTDLWPTPSLVPIFPAISMKRKLMLADWSVADGMVNMLVLWTFPPGTKPEEGKNQVQRFVMGGRVQAFALPEGVEVNIVTPPVEILNSSEKFWQPVSEIFAHFGYPLNSKSRGAGDLDSGPLDAAANRARLEVYREAITDHNTFWLKKIVERNSWKFDIYATLQSRDLDNNDAFRTFAFSLYNIGLLSIETMHDLAHTSTEREAARRKKEIKNGNEDLFAIRPSFSQTTGTAQDGRPPASENKPSGGTDASKGAGRLDRARPATSAKVTTK
jgi:hypothetical protein